MANLRCKVNRIDRFGGKTVIGILAIGDTISVPCGDTDHLAQVREDGLFYVDDTVCAKTAPFESNGYVIQPEVEFARPPKRVHPNGHICRYCIHWSRKLGREKYYEEVRLTCNTKCDMTKAITDQVTKDLGVPPVNPNDLGYCAPHSSLESGAAHGCTEHVQVGLAERAVRMRYKYLGPKGKDND